MKLLPLLITMRLQKETASVQQRRNVGRPHRAAVSRGCLAWVALLWVAVGLVALGSANAAPLASLDYKLVGNYLKVSPAAIAVPKGVAGSVLVEVANADGSAKAPNNPLAEGAYVEATLRGPSFPARRLVGQVNQPLMLPVLNLVGEYQLDNIRLVDASTGEVRMEGLPSSVPVNVFAEVLISRVTSRPLSLQEIQDKGIAIDESNFRAVEFEVGFVLDGRTIPIKFPVVAPDFRGSTEIIPAAELEKRLVEAQRINDQLTSRENVNLPPELEAAGLNLVVKGCNFELAEVTEPRLRLSIPPIPALMVIPGNIGYLNQFFSVQIFTENAAPANSGLSVLNLQAKLVLPPGADQVPSKQYDQPGDDPLRFARTGPNKIINEIQPIIRPGPDGVPGTADDILRIYPRETGQAEFLVEGLREGLHVMNLELTGDLDGLAAGLVKIKGTAAGSVLVRNPKFSLTFSHPRTVRSGELYEAFVTILNTSQVEANLVSVNLPKGSISGATLLSSERVQLGNILPGGSATARFQLRGERTGQIRFSNLTTGEDSLTGRFRLVMGVDERGVELSPDSIGYPDYVNKLPGDVFYAANRVLGQALSVYSAPILPPGVRRIPWSIIQTRVLELAEAGQRIDYGESLSRVLPDLALDWQGGRAANEGFDQIVSGTGAGLEWRQAVMATTEASTNLSAVARLEDRAPDLAGRGEAWIVAGSGSAQIEIYFNGSSGSAGLDVGDLAWSGGYRGTNGNWLVMRPASGVLRWEIKQPMPTAELEVLVVSTNGTGEMIKWTVTAPPAGSCLTYTINDPARALRLDPQCDGSVAQTFSGVFAPVVERAPELLVARQIRDIQSVRPNPSCYGAAAINYGTLLGVVFSKPMLQASANIAELYQLDNGNRAGFVKIQPGGRVALVSLKQGTGGVRPRLLTVTGATDPRGNPVVPNPVALTRLITEGVAVNGRVMRADGSPAANVPVTLTMNDLHKDPFDRCDQITSSISQVFTDPDGLFTFDFILAGVPYTISATDTGGIPPEAIDLILKSYRGGYFDRDRLLLQAASSNIVATLGSTNLTQAIRIAENLDRAIWSDKIQYYPGMQGQEIGVALRFRGRGTVTGRVISADGVTPAAQAAVNLFPDSGSRELGRGMFADSDGRFEFNGVPLGSFTIQVKTGLGQFRTVAGILNQVGENADMIIQLTAPTVEQIVRTSLRGIVTEADNTTPHANAQVFVRGVHGVVGISQSTDSGYWEVNDVPVGSYQVVAISMDGRRKGERSGIQAVEGNVNFVNVALQGTSVVFGRVENSSGQPVANALVAGGEALVRTDANGLFTLTGVPVGMRKISAGLEARFALNNFPRLGDSSLEVLPGVTNYVVVRLRPAGVIAGQVRDAKGNPVSGINVAIPVDNGFMWTKVNDNGYFRFINIPPGDYIVSAPAPPVKKPLEEALEDIDQNSSQDEIMAALGEAFASFFNVTSSTNSNPGSWGYTTTRVLADGDTGSADVRYFPVGTISGIVLNDQAIPIGARVRLTGLGMREDGSPGFVVRGDRDSDAATGLFEFRNAAMVGDWGIQAASPFYPSVLSTSGRTTDAEPNVTNVVMQFPPRRETHGRLVGTVVYPDGTPVSGAEVTTFFGPGIVNTTDDKGAFDNQMAIPAGGYSVEAVDPATGYRGKAIAQVKAGLTNHVEVALLGLGEMQLQVFQANGQVAPNAFVRIEGGIFRDTRDGTTDTNGIYSAGSLMPGWYNALVRFTTAAVTLEKRVGFKVAHNQLTSTNLTLGGTGTIRGTFRHLSDSSPVIGGRVAIGNVADVPTDAQGQFLATGVPLGTYRIVATDPVSGRAGVASATLSTVDQVLSLNITEQPQGELRGQVFQEGKSTPIAGASVSLNARDGLVQRRSVTTGSDGAYYFPAVTPGDYYVSAQIAGFHGGASQNFSMPDTAGSLNIDLTLPAPETKGEVLVFVFQPDGTTPASNVRVTAAAIGGGVADVDTNGVAFFGGLRLGTVPVRAVSLNPAQTFNAGQTSIVLTASVPSNSVSIKLSGVGAVSGQVFNSTGLVPVPFASLTLEMLSKLFEGQKRGNIVADGEGRFTIPNVPVGEYRLVAESQSLSASTNGVLLTHGETNFVRLTLAPSGVVIGRVLRADGTTPVPTNYAVLKFASQSSAAGVSIVQTDLSGRFGFTNVPLGNFTLDVSAILFNGLITKSGALSNNQQVVDLGDLRLDESLPFVSAILPEPFQVGVPVTNSIDIVFSEAMNPATVNGNTNAIYLRGPTNVVRAAVSLVAHPDDGVLRIARLTPSVPLRSLTTYEVAVISGERRNATGQILAKGPTDLVGRSIPQLFVSSFTTRDDDPPLLVSMFPANGANQVEPGSVLRLSFNEALRSTNIVFEVTGPSGAIPGTATLSLDGRILVFTPTLPWQPNRSYFYSVSNLVDLAGNRFAPEPLTSGFNTLDTMGPAISVLRLNRSAVAGAEVPVEAVLANPEDGVSVRFLRDLEPAGLATASPYIADVKMPSTGKVRLQAIATDQFGNDGEIKQIEVDVVPNEPPTVAMIRLDPTNNAASSGKTISFTLSATDDNAVTNVTVVGISGVQVVRTFTDGTPTNLTFNVPGTNVPGAAMQFVAQSTDSLGEKSPEVTLDYVVSDATRPVLALISPSAGAVLDPTQPLDVAVALSDNSSDLKLKVQLSSLVSATLETNITLAANVTQTNVIHFSITNAIQNGGTIQIHVTATDAAGNASSYAQSFTVTDVTRPTLVSTTPTNGAGAVSLWTSPRWSFSEPIKSLIAATNLVALSNEFGEAVAATIQLASQEIYLNPVSGLRPGTFYTNYLFPGIIDRATNVVVDGNGLPVPAEGWRSEFRTAAILTQVPTNNSFVVAGQRLVSRLTYERGLNANWFSWRFGTNAPITIQVSQTATNAATQLTVPTNIGPAQLNILMAAVGNLSGAWNQPTVNLEVRPRDVDDDNDGWLNGFEAERGMDPFVADADSADFDSDGLTNGQERGIGTDPGRPDTDNDGLKDGFEVALGTSPLKADTDEDGLNDAVDPQPLISTSAITFDIVSNITLMEGESTNILFTAISPDLPLSAISFGGTNSVPVFATLGNTTFTNTATNGVAYGELRLRPLLMDAGIYNITLKASGISGTNAASGFTNIVVTVLDNASFPVTRWKDATNGNFADLSRWSDGLPSTTKPGIIDLPGDYTVTINQDAAVGELIVGAASGTQTLRVSRVLTVNGSLQVRNGGLLAIASTINGPGTVSISSRATWTAGNMEGTGTTIIGSGAQLMVTGSDWKGIHTRRVHNMGSIVLAPSQSMTLGANAVLDNYGLIDVQTDFVVHNAVGGWATVSTFNNYGTIRKSAGIGSFELYSVFNNQGALVVDSGEFSCSSGGTSSGAVNLSEGTTLRFAAGTHVLTSASRIQGNGSIRFSGGDATIAGIVNILGGVNATGGVGVFGPESQVTPISYAVIGSNGRLEFSSLQDVEIGVLDLIGTLRGTGNVLVTSEMNWKDGYLDGTGSTVVGTNATFNISSSQHKNLIARHVINYGTMTWTGTGGMTIGANAVFDNYGDIDLTSEISVANAVGGWATASTFNNYGTFRKTAGTNVFRLGTTFNNSGQVIINAGSFESGIGGSSSGTFQVDAGASLKFWGGNHELSTGSQVFGAGSVHFNGGTVAISGAFDIQGLVSANSGAGVFNSNSVVARISEAKIASYGRLEFNSGNPIEIDTLNMGGGLRGTSSVTVHQTLNWTDGDMDGKGITRISSNATLVVSGTSYKAVKERVVINEGTGVWAGAATWTIGAGGQFRNAGTFEIQNDQMIATAVGGWGTEGWFINEGSVTKTAGAGATEIYAYFRNNGLVSLQSGTLALHAGQTNSGSFHVGTNATLKIGNGTHVITSTGAVSGDGRLLISAGTLQVECSLSVPLQLTGGNLNFAGPNVLHNFKSVVMEGGDIEGTAPVVFHGDLDWKYGAMRGAGSTTIAPGATVRFLTSPYNRYISRPLIVQGTGILENGASVYLQAGTLVNAAGGLLNIIGAATLNWNGSPVGITNNGTILKSGSGALTFGGSVPVYNYGSIQVAGGSAALNGNGLNAGTIQVASGASLSFANTYNHGSGSLLGGAGAILFSNGTHDLLGSFLPDGAAVVGGSSTVILRNTLSPSSALRIEGGTLRNEANQVLSNFALGSGTLEGSGIVTVTNRLVWQRGFMSGAGRTVLSAGALMTIEDTVGAKYLQRVLDNAGVVSVSAGAQIYMNNGRLNILSGGRLEILDALTLTHNGGSPMLNNEGTIVMLGTNALTLGSGLVFNNAGTTDLKTGALYVNGPGTNSGAFLVNSNALITFNANMVHAASSFIGGLGEIRFTGGTHNLLGSFKPQGILGLRGGTVTINESIRPIEPLVITNTASVVFTVDQSFRDLVAAGSSLGGSGNITVSNSLVWFAGDMTGTGRTIIPAAGNLIVQGGINNKILARALENSGTTLYAEGQRVYLQNGTFNNLTGGVFESTSGDLRLHSGQQCYLNNYGAWNKSDTNLFEIVGLPFNNYAPGQLNVLGGTFSMNQGGTNSAPIHIATNSMFYLPAGNLYLLPGTEFSGEGRLTLDGGTTVTLRTNINFKALYVTLKWASSIAGAFDVSNGPGGVLRFEKSATLAGSLRIGGSLETITNITLTVNGNLNLEAGSTVTNYGQIQVKGVINNNGAIIVGNPLVQLGSAEPVRLTLVGFTPVAAKSAIANETLPSAGQQILTGVPMEVILTWTGEPGASYFLESSDDAVHWSDCEATTDEVTSGQFRARAPAGSTSVKFFRTRME